MPLVYESSAKEAFNPRRISASRVDSLLQCGVAFQRKYIQHEPEERSGSAALFGSVVHLALEDWAMDRSQDLLTLMRGAWPKYCEANDCAAVLGFIKGYQSLSVPAIKLEHAIREAWAAKGKESKAPRMTAEFKKSAVAQNIENLTRKWLPKLNEGFYQFTDRDPLPTLYDESLVIAKRYEARYKHLPNAIHAELGFTEPWHGGASADGWDLNGYIDTIELMMDKDTGELIGVAIGDYKTYKKEPPKMKDWRQTVIYDIAITSLIERGALSLPDVPRFVMMDYVRLGMRKYFQVGPEDHQRLQRELCAYTATVEQGNFLPAQKGSNPDFCGFPGSCCLLSTAAAGGSFKEVEFNL